ncbi:MAG: type II toxin-antitoxin system RelB/DinJ family antitoxin [Eubacteriales bacterium]
MNMAKTSNVFARVEPDVKEQAEVILTELGIPMSNAVSMFLKQVILQRGIPFEMKLPVKTPLSLENLTLEQLDFELQKGFDEIEEGKGYSLESVREEMKRDYGL